MEFKLLLMDRKTEKPLNGVVQFIASSGQVLASLTTTGGALVLTDADSGLMDVSTTMQVKVPGYNTWSGSGDYLTRYGTFTALLTKDTTPLLVGAVLGTLGLGYFLGKRKRKMGGIKDISPSAQMILAVGALGGVGYLLYKLANRDQSGDTPAAAASELDRLAAQGIFPTFNEATGMSYVSQLVAAFNGIGTDDSAVLRVFGYLRNDADMYLLIKLFGKQTYRSTVPFMNTTANLVEAISDEMSAGEIEEINDTLTGNGVTVTF